MRTKVLLTMAVVGMLLLSFTAMTSNMGFKINIPMVGGGASNWVSLPWYNSYSAGVSLIFNELQPNVLEINRWNPTTSMFETYASAYDPDFALNAGQSLMLKLTSAQNWIVVGSHNPTATISVVGGGASNWLAVPYHTTSQLASALFNEIPNTLEINGWDANTSMFYTYASAYDPDFNITAGSGFMVKQGGTDYTWTPAHY